jgi:hypothetical protein
VLPFFASVFVRRNERTIADGNNALSFFTLHLSLSEQQSHEMAGRDPPPYLNTPEDRGGVVAVVSFTCIIISTFTNGVRIWNRQLSEAALGLDDALLVAANVSVIEHELD